MLELDICLTKYLERAYLEAPVLEQQTFESLLLENDSDIWDWLMGIQIAKNPFQAIIKNIQTCNGYISVKQESI